MSPASLLRQFEVIADAPGGVQRLREIILGLAFRGGLSANSTRGSQIPDGWTIASVGSLSSEIVSGFACNKKNEDPNGYVHLRTHNVGVNGKLNFDLLVRIAQDKVHPDRAELRAGDVLFNNTNSQELVGKTCLVDQDYDFAFSNHLTRIRLKPTVSPAYFVYYFNFLLRLGYFAQICNRWIGQAGINTKMLAEIEVPVAPKDEQRRIVAKVDQLMALCDELEERQCRRTEKRVSLNQSALHHLTTATDGAELYGHWRRIRDHFDLLYEVPETVAELRQAILQLAVRGKLVPQDPQDAPARELVEESAAALTKTNNSALTPFSGTPPHAIPDSWEWVRLEQIADLQIGRTPNTKVAAYWGQGEIPWVSIGDMPDSGHINGTQRSITPKAVEEVFKGQPPAPTGTLLMSFKLSIGKVAFLEHPAYHNEAIVSIRPPVAEIAKYLHHCLRGIDLQSSTNAAIKGQTLNKTSLQNLAIPLPPLAEQRRIVEKVDQLMALCDELEAKLTAARTKAEHLASAVVHHISAA